MFNPLICPGEHLKMSDVENAREKRGSRLTNPAGGGEAEELGRLIGVIAHEIKNPLSTIKVNLRLIDEEIQDAITRCKPASCSDIEQRLSRARRKLGIIDKEASRLEQILDGFLRYADRSKPQFADLDLNSLLSEMVDFYIPQAKAHSITMRQCFHKEPLICQLDTAMIKQAILNLFINATQAQVNGGGSTSLTTGELIVQTDRSGDFAHVRISDTGVGIPAERLSHIFEPYQSSRPDGAGLGLATVKKIVDAHEGTISVVSEPGKGTVFTISLPLAGPERKR
jgi:signal transduction histidine kinase